MFLVIFFISFLSCEFFLHVYLCPRCVQYPLGSEKGSRKKKGSRSFRTGITNGCELQSGAVNQTQVLSQSTNCSKQLSHLSSPQNSFLLKGKLSSSFICFQAELEGNLGHPTSTTNYSNDKHWVLLWLCHVRE